MSLTRSLTRPLTRKISRADLTQGFGGSFSPFALNPYLLFDARDSMVGTLENPTLDLNPALPETLDVITATRAGVATYTDPDGLIATASADTVRVDYTQGAELTPTVYQRVTNTEFDQAFWNFSSAMGAPVYNYDTAPNGEQEATRIVSNGGSYPQFLESIEGLTVGQQYTASFYVKSDGTSQIQQATHFTGLSGGIGFTPTADWQRVSYTITATATTHTLVIFTNNGSAPASSYLIWGPQLEEGTTASDFVANTTGSPKFLSSAVYSDRFPMILVEPSATNLVDNSNSFSASGTAVKTTGFEAPDGTNNSTKISNIQDGDGEKAHCPLTSVSGSTQYSGSIYIKGTGGQTIRVQAKRATTGSFSGSGTQTITFDGTWQRVTNLTWTTASNNNDAFIVIKNEFGTTADEVYLWGSQLEQGSVSTSVIPTSGSTVTRVADDLVISGSDFDFYNASEGTIYVELQSKVVADTVHTRFSFNDGTNGNSMYSLLSSNHDLLVKFGGNSTGYSSQSNVLQANEYHRLAASYIVNNFITSRNGSLSSTQPATQPIPPVNRLVIGAIENNTRHLNGHIKRFIYWPYHSDSL